jgi:SnoaL-like domain
MPWLAAFGGVVREAALLGDSDTTGPAGAEQQGDDVTRLVEAFPGGVTVDDPSAGRVEGDAALADYARESRAWLAERRAHPRSIALTKDARRAVGEFDVDLVQGGEPFVLPVAVVVEPDPGRRAVAVRVYHSHWPLLGRHLVRPPLLARDPAAIESDVVGEYQTALAAGDPAAWVAAFEPDGCFREPAGPQYRRCGTAALEEVSKAFFARGGIVLEHCTVTDDGVRAALEFNAVEWGGRAMPHQAGVAVYERGRTGRLADARV